MSEQWSGWNPHSSDRRAAQAALTPLQRLEWIEQTLLLWGPERLNAVRARRQREAERLWSQNDSPRSEV